MEPILNISVGSGADPSLDSQPTDDIVMNLAIHAIFPPARQHHRPLTGTELYSLVTEAYVQCWVVASYSNACVTVTSYFFQ